jgi:hypothetical protein
MQLPLPLRQPAIGLSKTSFLEQWLFCSESSAYSLPRFNLSYVAAWQTASNVTRIFERLCFQVWVRNFKNVLAMANGMIGAAVQPRASLPKNGA